MISSTKPLIAIEAHVLGRVLDDVVNSRHVRWVDPHNPDDDVHTGELRYLTGGWDDGTHRELPKPDDVRDAFVRITDATGWEHFVPLATLVLAAETGCYALA